MLMTLLLFMPLARMHFYFLVFVDCRNREMNSRIPLTEIRLEHHCFFELLAVPSILKYAKLLSAVSPRVAYPPHFPFSVRCMYMNLSKQLCLCVRVVFQHIVMKIINI